MYLTRLRRNSRDVAYQAVSRFSACNIKKWDEHGNEATACTMESEMSGSDLSLSDDNLSSGSVEGKGALMFNPATVLNPKRPCLSSDSVRHNLILREMDDWNRKESETTN